MESRIPCRWASVAEMSGVVLAEQIVDRLPHVPEETLGDFQAVHHAAGDHRQQRQRIVAAEPLELLAELGRPVLRADLPTVDVRGDQRAVLAHQRPVVGDQLAHQAVEMHFGRLLAELVAFQAAAFHGRGMIVLAGAWCGPCAAASTCRPARPSASRPSSPSFAVRFDDAVARHDRVGRQRGERRAQGNLLASPPPTCRGCAG